MNYQGTPPSTDPAMAFWLHAMVPRSRHRAIRAKFAHDLADDHAERLFRLQHGVCAISGLPFSLARFDGVLVQHPFAPSLDRILSKGGYTKDNVRLVCIAVNFGMGQWGEELYMTFARAAVEFSDRAGLAASIEAAATLLDSDSGRAKQMETTWTNAQCERIEAAETIASTLSGRAAAQQRRRLASLRRNLTLGPAGLRAAAAKAHRTRAAVLSKAN